jgi:ABC-type amino acid transport system permease subunit
MIEKVNLGISSSSKLLFVCLMLVILSFQLSASCMEIKRASVESITKFNVKRNALHHNIGKN